VIPPIATHFSICLSVVCHIRAPCLNRSTDLDAIWQVHLWVQRHIELDAVLNPRGDLWSNPQRKHAMQIAVNRNEKQFCLFLNYFGLVSEQSSKTTDFVQLPIMVKFSSVFFLQNNTVTMWKQQQRHITTEINEDSSYLNVTLYTGAVSSTLLTLVCSN